MVNPAPALDLPSAARIRRSVTPEGIVSFEDGKAYTQLKRHLTKFGMSPADYRAKWGLPKDYPMVSPNYSAKRSELAKAIGLGKKGRGAGKSSAAAPAPDVTAAVEVPKARISGRLGLFGRRKPAV